MPAITEVVWLDLGHLFEEGVRDGYFDGTLPQWLFKFRNLRELRAQNSGLLYIDERILQLKELRVLYLDNNLIFTWPYFLYQLPRLQCMSLRNNPCLKKLSMKSPTFNEKFFSLPPGTFNSKHVPAFIRGPEWYPAARARSSRSGIAPDLGFYFGGIYTQSTPSDLDNHGLLTVLGPCILHKRREEIIKMNFEYGHGEANQIIPAVGTGEDHDCAVDDDCLQQYEHLSRLFRDIDIIVHRDTLFKRRRRELEIVQISAFDRVGYNSLNEPTRCLPTSPASLSQVPYWISQLLAEDGVYVYTLRHVLDKLKHDRTSRSLVAVQVLSKFEEIHVKRLNPNLTDLAFAYKNEKAIQIDTDISDLTSNVLELCSCYTDYALSIGDLEDLLETSKLALRFYKERELEQHVEQYLRRITRLTRHISGKSGSLDQSSQGKKSQELQASLENINLAVPKSHRLSQSMDKFGEWISCQLGVNHERNPCRVKVYLYTPFFRLVRLETIFRLLASADRRFSKVSEELTRCREISSTDLVFSRRLRRIKELTLIYKCDLSVFDEYRWDAQAIMESRTYLEPGILMHKTNDVFDRVSGKAASVVAELFGPVRKRVVTIVAYRSHIGVWDDNFKALVLTVPRGDVHIALLRNEPHEESVLENQRVMIVFIEYREAMILTVNSFNAPYARGFDNARELVEASTLDFEIKI